MADEDAAKDAIEYVKNPGRENLLNILTDLVTETSQLHPSFKKELAPNGGGRAEDQGGQGEAAQGRGRPAQVV